MIEVLKARASVAASIRGSNLRRERHALLATIDFPFRGTHYRDVTIVITYTCVYVNDVTSEEFLLDVIR